MLVDIYAVPSYLSHFWYITGKGRGRQVIAVARTADLIVMMLDATKKEIQK